MELPSAEGLGILFSLVLVVIISVIIITILGYIDQWVRQRHQEKVHRRKDLDRQFPEDKGC